MNRLKLFVENFMVYGFGSIISKIIPFLMLPVITRLMPDTYYFGLNDIFNTIVSFGSSLAVMGMYDAMFRMFFERSDDVYKKEICSTTLLFTLTVSAIVSLSIVIIRKCLAEFLFGDETYAYIVGLAAMSILVGAVNNIVSAPTRMENKRKAYLVTNTLSSILSYAVSIPLLLKGYYFIALPSAALLASFNMGAVFWLLNKGWFKRKYFCYQYLKEMLKIGLPLLPVTVIYWVFNSSDRIMISKLIGAEHSGIYAIGAKAGQVSMLIYTAFAGGWQYFAFSTMKEKDQVKLTSNIFEYLGSISFLATMGMAACAKPIFEFIFQGDYVKGYIIAPYLFLAPLLQMLFQIAANQFLVIKKTWPNLWILMCGAIVNVILNIWLIPAIGIEGAAIATVVGYVVADILCVIILCKLKLLILSGRFVKCLSIFVGICMVYRLYTFNYFTFNIILWILMVLMYIYLYRKEIKDNLPFKYNM